MTRYLLDEVLDARDAREAAAAALKAASDERDGMDGITERVERGAALLDEKRPGWWQLIDLAVLDIGSRCGCIIGQVGGLTKAADRGLSYQIVSDGLGVGYMDEIPMGFEAPSTRGFGRGRLAVPGEYAALTEAWRDLITARRERARSGPEAAS